MSPFDPMKQILSIYEASRNTYTIAHLDDFEVPQCESHHHGGRPSAEHSGAAAFLLVVPCHCFDGYRCKPFIDWLLTPSDIYCGMCDSHYEPSDITVLPIGGQK